MATSKKASKKRYDGWQNVLTNLGVQNKDKRTGMGAVENYLSEQVIASVYQADDIFAKVVDKLPEDMTREGFTVIVNENEDLTSEIQEIFENLDLDAKIEKGLKYARLYGGAGMIMGVQDGRLPWQEVNFNSIKGIDYIALLNRFELMPDLGVIGIDKDVMSKNFGRPTYYKLQDSKVKINDTNYVKIHHDRIIRFDGIQLGRDQMPLVDYWGDSILGRLYDQLRNFQSSHSSAALIMEDFTQLVIKLKNLSDMIASGDSALVQERFALLTKTASIINAVVLEQDEEVERKTTNVSGVDKILDKVNARFLAATEYPHTVLFGEGADGGLGTQGQSEKRDYYETVKNKQESILRPILKQILKFIFLSKDGPTKGKMPKKVQITFNPLWMPSQKEIAETRKITAETDAIYIDRGVLDVDEVAQSRYGNGEYSIETVIDDRVRGLMNETPDEE